MKYFKTDDIDIPFGFYLKDGRKIYTYCSNCECENEYSLNLRQTLKEFLKTKEKCPCCNIPYKLYNAKLDNKTLSRGLYRAEFCKTEKGFNLNIYWISYNFASLNYDVSGFSLDDYFNETSIYPLKRYPVFEETLSAQFVFEDGKKVEYFADEYRYFYNTCYCTIEKKKNFPYFHSSLYRSKENMFCLESLNELKYTRYEFFIRYISDIFDFSNDTKEFVSTLICIWNNPKLLTVYKSGFKRLVIDYSMSKLFKKDNFINYTPNYLNLKGKNLSKILGIDPSKIKLERKSLTYEKLEITKKLVKYGIDPIMENVIPFRMSLIVDYERLGLLNAKVFKYIRHQVKQLKSTDESYFIASGYLDYLKEIEYLKYDKTSDVLYPKNFKKAHERTSNAVRNLKASEKNEVFKAVTSKYKEFDSFGSKYSVELVECSKSLINASNYMHNCSASYIDRIISGKVLIFLVKSQKSKIDGMLSLNIIGNNFTIGQLFAKNNKSVTAEVRSFVDTWYQNKVLKLCA